MGIESIRALHHSLCISEPKLQNVISSLWQKITSAYKNAVKGLIEFLRSRNYTTADGVVGAFLLEPLVTFKSSINFPYGWLNKFQYYGLNPEKLTESQAQKRPLLAIHGDNHNQSAWLTLAKALEHSYGGPIYTVNLNLQNSSWTEQDRSILYAKIEEIKSQYQEHGIYDVEIDIVGHSTGASLAFYTALEESSWKVNEGGTADVDADKVAWRQDIGNIVRIGTPTSAEENSLIDNQMRDRIFEIDGTEDKLVDARSTAKRDHRAKVPCGHLELIFSQETCEHISRWLYQQPLRA